MITALLSTLFGCGAASSPKGKAKAKAKPMWPDWKARFVLPEGRIADTGNGGVSHSEGQGYAMLLAERAGDRVLFDRVWGWTDAVLARRDTRLFSWRFDPAGAPPVSDPNNATDGDLLIAWALMRAAKRWGDPRYEQHSRAIRVAIGTNLVVSIYGRIVLLPGLTGFVTPQRTVLNPSYYVWPALDAFRAADPEGPWALVIADGERLLEEARFGAATLPTDWVDLDPQTLVQPSMGREPRFGFDAIRVPLYLAWSRRTAFLDPYRVFWAEPANRVAWFDVLTGEKAPFPLSAGGKAVIDLTLGKPVATELAAGDDYYSATLQMLAKTASQAR